MSDKALERYIETAYDSDCPKDQVENFLKAKYYAYPWQLLFHSAAREADKRCEAHKKDQTLKYDGTCGCGPIEIGLGGARGPGKALALDTRIPTKNGWTTMGAIKKGDVIFAPDGTFTSVMGVSPIQKDRTCYEVWFSDGSMIVADAGHLWVTYTKSDRTKLVRRTSGFRENRRLKRGKVRKDFLVGKNIKEQPEPTAKTTQQILETLRVGKEINHAVLVAEPIAGDPMGKMPIDPYVLGIWLGDGDKDRGYITCFDEGILEELERRGYQTRSTSVEGRYIVDRLHQELKATNLLKNKHVPQTYLRATAEVRKYLLSGLNDSDGYCDKDGAIEFTNTNKTLAENYFELALSLGNRATKKETFAYLNGRKVSKKWRIRYTSEIPLFVLERKANKQKLKKTNNTKYRYIVDVVETKSVPVKCITVDHPSHCFLAGDNFITTHNSHAVLSQVGLDDVQRVPKLKALFLRQTGSAAKESFEDVIERALAGKADYDYVNNTLKFPNRSKVILGGFYTERDIDKYVGIEYDLIIIEELNQLTKEKYIRLKGSLRTSKPDWRPRVYASFNPGGIGHGFVKETFVQPYRDGLQTTSRFIPSTYKENPALNAEYIQYLESLEGDIGKAWREGEWDLFAGQFFNTWKYDVHVCDPFKIPEDWKKVISIDYGYAAQSSVGWWAISPDNQVFRYRELYKAGLTYRQLTEEIVSLTPENEYISYWVADPAIWAKKGESDLSGAEVMKARYRELQKDKNRTRPLDLKPLQQELNLTKGVNDRASGWDIMREYMSVYPDQDGNPTARLQVFSTCTDFHRTIPALVHDEHRVEDLDTTQEDHQADEARYFLMSQPVPHESRNAAEERRFKLRMKQKKIKSRGISTRSYGRT